MRLFAVMITMCLVLGSAAYSRQADRLERVAKYVDDVTLLVVEIDVDRFDTDALLNDFARTLSDVAREQDPAALGKSDEMVAGPKKAAVAWREKFKKAGGRYIYVLVQFNPSVGEPLTTLVPLNEGADANAVTEAIRDLPLPLSRDPETRDGMVVAGALELRRDKPAAEAPRRNELSSLLARANEAPVRLAFIPSETVRKALAENMTALPAEVGGGPTEPLTSGITSGYGSLSLPPAWNLKLVLECPDEAKAKDVAASLDAVLKSGLERGDPLIVKPIVESLQPRAEGSIVVISAGVEKFERLKRAAIPAMAKARTAARRVVAASNIRQQIMGCLIYAQDNKNEWPASLQTLVDKGIIQPAGLANPDRPGDRGFVYIRPNPKDLENADWSSHIVVHESFDAWPPAGIWVGFADGRVQMVTDQKWFQERLADAMKRSAK